jgi:hypothetical protein
MLFCEAQGSNLSFYLLISTCGVFFLGEKSTAELLQRQESKNLTKTILHTPPSVAWR